MTKETTRALIIICATICFLIFAVFLFIFLSAIAKPDSKYNSNEFIKMEEFKEGFMEGCVEAPVMEEYCACFYEEIKDNYTDREIINLYKTYRDGDETDLLKDERVIKIYNKCIDKL